MNPRLNVCVALSALALSAMLPAAAERGAEGFLDRAESVLREEARSFHEDVTSSNRWREWALHRANGEETDVQGWLSSRWEETPVRLADGYAASLADWAAADLRESDWVEALDFSFQLPIEGRDGRLNVSAVGPLARGLGGGDGVLGWQFPLAVGAAEDGNTELSGNVGLFYRQVLGGSGLAGLNVFGDYQDEGADGSFWRWSLGAEYRTAWADVFANRYFPSAVSHRRLVSGGKAERIAYSAGGYDAEVRVHAPGSDWLEGFAEYSLWEGEHGDEDEEGFRYGFRFSPRTGGVADGFRLEANYDAAEGGLGGRFDYSWTVGEFRRIGGVSAFDPRSHLLSPVERSHAQRVRVRTRDLSWGPIVGRSARGAEGDESPCADLPSDSPPDRSELAESDISRLRGELEAAVRANDYALVCEKLEAGANPLEKPVGSDAALHYAASVDALAIATLLVSRMSIEHAASSDASKHLGSLGGGYNPFDVLGRNDEAPLHRAAEFGSFRVARYLLDNLLERGGLGGNYPQADHSPLNVAITVSDRRMAELLRSYGERCKDLRGKIDDHAWCKSTAAEHGLRAPLDWIGEMTLYATGGYQGSLPTVSAANSEGNGVTKHYRLQGESAVFSFNKEDRVLSTKSEVLLGSGRLYSVTLRAEGEHASMLTRTLYATVAVSVLSFPDVARTVTASPYADYASSGGGLVTLSSLWDDLPETLTLSYEKKTGSSVELALGAQESGWFLDWSGEEGVLATLGVGYKISAWASAPSWLAGSLSFSAEVEAGCAAGGEYGGDLPGEDADIFSAVESSKLNDACWLIGEKGLTVVESRYVPGVGDSVAAYKTDATPLHWAVKGDNADARERMAGLLLHYGADPSAQNEAGAAPLDLAASGDDAELLRDAGGVCYVEADDRCGLRFLPGPSAAFSATVAHGFSGEVWSVTVKAATDADAEEEVFSRLDILDPEDARLSADVEAVEADEGKHVLLVSSESPLMAGEPLSASVAVWSGLQTLWASLAVTALYPVAAEEKEIDADASGLIHQFTLSGYENASFSAAEGSAMEFNVSSNGEVSRNVILDGETVYKVVAEAEDEGFLGAVSLTLNISVRQKVTRAEFSTGARYRAAMAGGYEGAMLTLSAADDQVSLSYLEDEEDGLNGSSFSLVSLLSGDYAVSLETAMSGPGIAVLKPRFEFQRTGFPLVTATADIRVTILGPYSDSAVIQHNATSVEYRFVVPGFAGATFEEVEGSGSNDGFYSVSSADGTISWSLSLTASVSHTIVVRGKHDGFVGDALFTLALSVSFCKADMEGASEDDVATLNDKLIQAARDGDAGAACELLQQGADAEAMRGGYTPLHYAAGWGHLDVVKYLLSRNDVNVNRNHRGETPLYWAAYNGHLDVVKYLLSRNDVSVNVRNNRGETPLFWAVRNGHLDVVKYLSSRDDVDVNARTDYGYTSLLQAALYGYLEAVKYLSSRDDVDVNARENVYGYTSLDLALYLYSYDRDDYYYMEMATLLRARGGVCLVWTYAACGLVMRPLHSTVVVAENHVGAALAVTATTNSDASSVYRLIHSTANSDDFSFNSATGDLTPNPGVLTEGMLVTVSIQAVAEAQSVTVERVVSVSVRRKVTRAEFSTGARYRAAMAGGYEGAVLTLSAADDQVSLSYLEDEEDGLNGSSFSLISLSSGDYAVSLETAMSGPGIAVLKPRFEFQRTGFPLVTATADIRVTILGPYSDLAVIQHNATSVEYRFVVPGFAGATFEEVEGSGSNDGFYSVSSADGTISWSLSLTASVSHTIVVRGKHDGFVGDALFTLALSVSFCKADMEGASEDDVATLNDKLIQAARDGDAGAACELLQQGADAEAMRGGYTPLHYAAGWGHLDVVKYLLSRNDVNVNRNHRGETPLYWAAYNGHLDVVKYLLSRNDVSVNVRNNRGETPLFWAVRNGHLDVVKYLSSRDDVDVNARTDYGYTSLLQAALYGYLEAVKYLSSRDDVDVNARENVYGYTSLDLALYLYSYDRDDYYYMEMATLLRARGGVCLVWTYAACGLVMRPLHSTVVVAENHVGAALAVTATTNSDASSVYRLIHSTANSDDFSFNSATGDLTPNPGVLTEGMLVTVSIQAVAEAQSVTVERVVSVSAAAAPWAGGVLSNYPSLLTASSEYMGVLATLSATEEDVAVSYDSGLNEKVFTLRALPSGKAELSLVARLGGEDVTATAVVALSKYGHAPTLVTARVTVEALPPVETRFTVFSGISLTLSLSARHGGMRYEKISGSAELSVSDSGGIVAITSLLISNSFTWYHLEARADSPGILGGERFSVSLLAASSCAEPPSGADLNLIRAINRRADGDEICGLLRAGADVNAENGNKATPLHRAVVRNRHNIASLLLFAGAEVDAQNKKGKTSLHLAAGLGHAGMVSLLLTAGANAGLADNDGKTPLDVAVENGWDAIAADIIAAGG